MFESPTGTLSVPFYIPEATLVNDEDQDFYYFGVEAGYYIFRTLGEQSRKSQCVKETCEFDTL